MKVLVPVKRVVDYNILVRVPRRRREPSPRLRARPSLPRASCCAPGGMDVPARRSTWARSPAATSTSLRERPTNEAAHLVMHRTNDPIIPLINAKILARLIRGARLFVVDDG